MFLTFISPLPQAPLPVATKRRYFNEKSLPCSGSRSMPEAEGQGSCPQHGGSPQNGVRAETLPMIFADAGLVDWSGWKMRLSSLTVELSELVSEVHSRAWIETDGGRTEDFRPDGIFSTYVGMNRSGRTSPSGDGHTGPPLQRGGLKSKARIFIRSNLVRLLTNPLSGV